MPKSAKTRHRMDALKDSRIDAGKRFGHGLAVMLKQVNGMVLWLAALDPLRGHYKRAEIHRRQNSSAARTATVRITFARARHNRVNALA